jgi:Txe/YoeB family toxin of toxin-antitoxin system
MKKSNFKIKFSQQARQDLKRISKSPYAEKFVKLIHLIEENPFAEPPLFEMLLGDQKYSRRINIQHRVVYEVDMENRIITILSCWTHYHGK